ncbi:MAG TPA: tape measure protein [Clostridia bacterium]|nr:tape measure protein [Clostridia bacterium]
MRDVSLMISAKDNYSDALKKMQQTQTVFRKDLSMLNSELDRLNRNKITLKTDLTQAKNELKTAEQAFKATGNEASRLQLEAAQANYDNIKSNLDLVSKAAKQTERDMQNLTGTLSKTETRAGGAGDTLSKLASAGLGAMFGRAAADAGGVMLGSAFGTEMGGAITSMLSGAATGAAMGSIAGPMGTAIGAGVGLATGTLQAATQMFTKRDDAYKDAVSKLYEDVLSGRAEQLQTGTEIAGRREMRQISFGTLLGDETKAQAFLQDLIKFAEVTPFQEEQLAAISKTMLAFGYTSEQIIPMLTAVGDAGSALSMTGEDMVDVATSLGRMQMSGKTQERYLRPLMERGIPVYEYLAKSMGKTKEQVIEMVSKGLIPGEKAARVIADYMGTDFAGNMEKQAKTYEGIVSILGDVQVSIDAAMGEGFTSERKKGVQAQIDYYEGEGGERLKEANRLIGIYEASLVNKQEELEREAIDNALELIQTQGITDYAEMGRLLQEAKATAAIQYAETEEFQGQHEAQMALIGKIQSEMTEPYWKAGYELGKSLTKGIVAAYAKLNLKDFYLGENGIEDFLMNPPPGNNAFGMRRVPYDGYPIIAHEGEQLLTAGQARRGDGAGFSVAITGNSFIVREEADIQRVASAIADELAVRQAGYVG